jgi:hypothetical protein
MSTWRNRPSAARCTAEGRLQQLTRVPPRVREGLLLVCLILGITTATACDIGPPISTTSSPDAPTPPPR